MGSVGMLGTRAVEGEKLVEACMRLRESGCIPDSGSLVANGRRNGRLHHTVRSRGHFGCPKGSAKSAKASTTAVMLPAATIPASKASSVRPSFVTMAIPLFAAICSNAMATVPWASPHSSGESMWKRPAQRWRQWLNFDS
mmetsp:Transcript_66428/g.183500  ORF Transcript_66428/g.183500 Transcript_66428/m.183500 type:complete len:140 (+) Transcript_66428:39-458(+)